VNKNLANKAKAAASKVVASKVVASKVAASKSRASKVVRTLDRVASKVVADSKSRASSRDSANSSQRESFPGFEPGFFYPGCSDANQHASVLRLIAAIAALSLLQVFRNGLSVRSATGR
jgi:hypothetical protein